MKESIKIINSLSFPFKSSCEPYFIRLEKGKYKFEAWGASGGGDFGGHGAYASGVTTLFETQHFFIYVGGRGENDTQSRTRPLGGCNGGGKGGLSVNITYYNGAGGGGSTDVRLDSSVDSRILVAAGGGGSTGRGRYINTIQFPGGVGGDEKGGMASGMALTEEERKKVPTQESGYAKVQGQDGRDSIIYYPSGAEGNGGAGGGYYGGYTTSAIGTDSGTGGGGGSSFVNNSFFKVNTLKAGDKDIYSPFGKIKTGNSGDGFFRITPIVFETCHKSYLFPQKIILMTFFVFLYLK